MRALLWKGSRIDDPDGPRHGVTHGKFLDTSSRKISLAATSPTPATNGHSDRSTPTLFLLVRPRTSRPAQWRNLSSLPRASQAPSFPPTIHRLTALQYHASAWLQGHSTREVGDCRDNEDQAFHHRPR